MNLSLDKAIIIIGTISMILLAFRLTGALIRGDPQQAVDIIEEEITDQVESEVQRIELGAKLIEWLTTLPTGALLVLCFVLYFIINYRK